MVYTKCYLCENAIVVYPDSVLCSLLGYIRIPIGGGCRLYKEKKDIVNVVHQHREQGR
ncbi:MAG: hypothetical protein QW584_00975 [Thermofilaceae archaeon]